MSAEFFITFADRSYFANNRSRVECELMKLSTFTEKHGPELRFWGLEDRDMEGRWSYDVRLVTLDDTRILVEISAHPKSIESALSSFLRWLRRETAISVLDEDGELAGW